MQSTMIWLCSRQHTCWWLSAPGVWPQILELKGMHYLLHEVLPWMQQGRQPWLEGLKIHCAQYLIKVAACTDFISLRNLNTFYFKQTQKAVTIWRTNLAISSGDKIQLCSTCHWAELFLINVSIYQLVKFYCTFLIRTFPDWRSKSSLRHNSKMESCHKWSRETH